MERFPVELLYVLGFIAFVLFNYIAQRNARQRQEAEERAQGQAGEQQAQPQSDAAASADLDDDVWGRTPAAPPPVAVLVPRPAPLPPPPLPRRLHPARALLTERRDLRRAVVLMMVLGPCRAQEPPEER